MESAIFYFSGTGNSLKAAETISAGIGNNELVSIAKAVKAGKFEYDYKKVGFVFPLYYLGLPKIVQEFVSKVDLSKADYIFAVITRGWPVVGGAIRQMKRLTRMKEHGLDMGAYICMPMNDFTLVSVDNHEKQERKLGKFDGKIKRIITSINSNQRRFDIEPIGFMLDKRNKPFVEQVNTMDQYYSVSENCTGCNLCARLCPVSNIEMRERKPEWLHNCEMCLSCFHYCPKKAICYKDKSTEVIRYHHPEVNANHMIGTR